MSGRNTHGWQRALICGASLFCFTSALQADVLVNDTWRDGTDGDPAAPVYSEAGVDADADGDLESAWYQGGAGSLDPVGANGPLRGDLGVGGTSSASWTSYFTAEGSEVNLAQGERVRVTWNFALSGVNNSNTSQNFRVALVDSPAAARLAANGAPGSGAYTGYGMFMNMGGTLGNANPFRLMERSGASGALLSGSGDWSPLANGATSGNAGYAAGVEYSFIMDILRNGSDAMEINVSMTGGNLNNSGTAAVSFTDPTANNGAYSFDTFAIRPSGATTTAAVFDTSLFKVEYFPIPEPTTLSLLAGVAAMAVRRRR
ncbi:MAG TPA: PEP-CTERM sorting domain-containing protein [Tepidisphaeraceae bacterium]|nr:PEP-CTERM sorting domain-containing protein [Tepidisphaeraceae bacterium]